MAPKFSDQEDKTLIMCVSKHSYLYNTKSRNQNPDMKEAAWTAIAGTVGREAAACKKRWRDIKDHYYKVRRRQSLFKTERLQKCKWPLYNALSFLSKIFDEMHTVKIVKVESLVEEDNNTEDSERKYVEEMHSECGNEIAMDAEKFSESEKMSDIAQETIETQLNSPNQNDEREMQAFVQRFHETETQYSSDAENIAMVSSKFSSEDALQRERYVTGNEDDVDLFMKSVAITMKKLPPERIAQAKVEILLLVSKLQFPSQFQKQ